MTSSDVLSCYEQELAQADDLQWRTPHRKYHLFDVLPQRRQHNYSAVALSHKLPLHCWQLAAYVNCTFMERKHNYQLHTKAQFNIIQYPVKFNACVMWEMRLGMHTSLVSAEALHTADTKHQWNLNVIIWSIIFKIHATRCKPCPYLSPLHTCKMLHLTISLSNLINDTAIICQWNLHRLFSFWF
jgi:hypothetical protein